MPRRPDFTPEFRAQAVRFVAENMEPTESRKEACERLGSKVAVKPVTLYNWVKADFPKTVGRSVAAGSLDELRAQVAALKKENRELSRANDILRAASTFFGAELDRQSRR
jgi:transposase